MSKIKESMYTNHCQSGDGATGSFMHCWQKCKILQPLCKMVCNFLKRQSYTYNLTSHLIPIHFTASNTKTHIYIKNLIKLFTTPLLQ